MPKTKLLKMLVIASFFLPTFFTSMQSNAQEGGALVPNQWLYSKNKILTHFYKCTSDKCNKSSLVSYHFQDVTKVTPDQFKAGINSIAGNFKNLGYKYKFVGKAETLPAPDGSHYTIYMQKNALTDPKGKTVQQISGLIVGDKISISMDSVSSDMSVAKTNFVNFANLISITLGTYETTLKGGKKATKCIKGKMIPVCFGPT